MNKSAFYSAGGYIQLPEKHIKAYVDEFCDEFKRTDTDTKLMHSRLIINRNMSQSLSEKNLGRAGFERLVKIMNNHQ